MKLKHTQAKKARRLNYWPAYQNFIFGMSVFMRRVQGYYGADAIGYSAKHPELDNAVEGYKSRLALQSNGIHPQAR